MKIFQIGFNKCGTKTIHHYLHANGVRSIHWDEGRLALRIFKNLANGDKLLAGYEDFDAFTDMEFLNSSGSCFLEAYKLFPYLAEQYPDAAFILNTRDPDAWIRSRLNHKDYATGQMAWFEVESEADLIDTWRVEWEQHHQRVIEFFSRTSYRFFVCKIEADLPGRLNDALPELQLDKKRYELRHATASRKQLGLMDHLRQLKRHRRAIGGKD